MKGLFRKLKGENGQAVVELAITLPLLLLLLCGILDYGWLFFNKLSISNYSREATRYAIVNGNIGSADSLREKIIERVNQIAMPDLVKDLSVHVNFSDPTNINNGDVTVDISCMVSSLTPITNPIATNGKIQVDSKVTMRMES